MIRSLLFLGLTFFINFAFSQEKIEEVKRKYDKYLIESDTNYIYRFDYKFTIK